MAKKKTLLDKWRAKAYDEQADKASLQKLWIEYFQKEKEIYQQLLKNPDEEVKGTVKELADKYSVDVMTMTGFLDGINESLKVENPIETMEEDQDRNREKFQELYVFKSNTEKAVARIETELSQVISPGIQEIKDDIRRLISDKAK